MMKKTNIKPWVGYLIFGLTVFLVFCLIFESSIQLPSLVAWLGRWHPLILHFPIVLLVVAIFLGLTTNKIPKLLLVVATISALLTAISGFMLAADASEKGDLLIWHQRLGSAVAFLAVLWYVLVTLNLARTILIKVLQVVLGITIFFAGHYGGMVTHGEDFLALPTLGNKSNIIPENPLIYAHIVQPILDDKCISCHNGNKKKGELLLTNFKEIKKGGENGEIIDETDYKNSTILKLVHLPLEDENHMPPEGKPQLSISEIQILERWIALGANDTLQLSHLNSDETLVGLVRKLQQPTVKKDWSKLPEIDDEVLKNLNSNYVNITRFANQSNALNVIVFTAPTYNDSIFIELDPIAKNIVQLDLSALPLGEQAISFIAKCVNLEWLEVDKTSFTDENLEKLKGLTKLEVIKAYDTEITDKSLAVFENFKNLKKMYVAQTNITINALDAFKKEHQNISVDAGINPSIETFFVVKEKDTVAVKKEE
tara:strand:- start:10441 stop:11892 length:1452 start_codon:yes stop_codon:yes gene_type:complete